MIYSPNSESRIRTHIADLELKQRIKEGERRKDLFDQLERDRGDGATERPSFLGRLWRWFSPARP